ncbi:hypothetical protein GBAR_LOCUS23266 [Geodia barretti]|uniref:Uncharacterized protein n=1 Tax=Geodia barretti TaxID=519541 RepID=A0AA35X8A3_GEOBA|nr:hypothetical protein GBAR_LOCUS23266 [Geodia barretti]
MGKHITIGVEIVIRFLTLLLGSLPALIASAVALGLLTNVPIRLRDYDYYDYDDYGDKVKIDDVTEDHNRRAAQLRNNVYMATGLAIGVTCLGVITQLLFIPFRLWFFSRESFLFKIFVVFVSYSSLCNTLNCFTFTFRIL